MLPLEGDQNIFPPNMYSQLLTDFRQAEESKDVSIMDDGFKRHLIATQIQVAMINKMLPKGYKFESFDAVKRQMDLAKLNSKQPILKRKKVRHYLNIKAQQQMSDDEDRRDLSGVYSEKMDHKQKQSESNDSVSEKRVSHRQKKPKNKEDLGYEEKKSHRHQIEGPKEKGSHGDMSGASGHRNDEEPCKGKIFMTTVDSALK